jgi:hypothetical protein
LRLNCATRIKGEGPSFATSKSTKVTAEEEAEEGGNSHVESILDSNGDKRIAIIRKGQLPLFFCFENKKRIAALHLPGE